MKIYISGGAKNGKSTKAQNLAVEIARRENLPLYYVATMVPTDAEDRERIERHRRERSGLGFTTIEKAKSISEIFGGAEEKAAEQNGVYLLDSVTALLANNMFPIEKVSEQDASEMNPNDEGGNLDANSASWFNPDAADEVIDDLKSFLEKARHAVLVSDYIYGDPAAADGKETDIYMRGLAKIDREIASLCDEVIEVSAGISGELKI